MKTRQQSRFINQIKENLPNTNVEFLTGDINEMTLLAGYLAKDGKSVLYISVENEPEYIVKRIKRLFGDEVYLRTILINLMEPTDTITPILNLIEKYSLIMNTTLDCVIIENIDLVYYNKKEK